METSLGVHWMKEDAERKEEEDRLVKRKEEKAGHGSEKRGQGTAMVMVRLK